MGLVELWQGKRNKEQTMKHFLLAYTILITLYAAGLHTGEIASRMQACVSTADYITQLERASK
jgi:hypothetical protein